MLYIPHYMTEKDTIEHIITTGKFPRTFDDYTNYFFLVAPIGFVAIGFSMMYNYIKFHSGLPILTLSVLFISFGIFFSIFVLNRLNDNMNFQKHVQRFQRTTWIMLQKKLRQNF